MSRDSHDPLSLLEEEIPRLRRYARYLVRDVDYADDLVQECLVRAVDKIHSWQSGTNMRAWLLVILQNVFRNDYRRKKRETSAQFEFPHHFELSVGPSQDSRMALLEVRDAFLKLTEEHREILLLVAVEGLQYEEAAVALDVPIGTVRSRLARARTALRQLTENANVEPLSSGERKIGD